MPQLPGCVAFASILFGLLTGCAAQNLTTATDSLSQQSLGNRPGLNAIAPAALPPLRQGQVIYVPIYSEVYDFNQEQTFQITATLSLRNTDLAHPIVIETVDYYDSAGEKIRTYLEQPLELAPLASFEVVVPKDDQTGGVGANFIVVWRAADAVSNPVVEAVMISTISQQGISFVSPGRVIQERSGE
ncbi:DUF3124 domain-containing protein [Halomicronema sp. CCY15110]|uniref:DUF3124 domain-containing protein n=1 Tax=Halomicronema sp. CCY15110 TaxID=2767773 RepID=UPI001950A022|nr:DUF3124 domain-containing protein [Halomicronema sp. CCY15110]